MAAFMPHGYCFLWERNLVYLHVVSDSLIAVAYFALPILLWLVIRKRPDIPFNWLFALFGSFILSCGMTHILAVWTLWHPTYWEEGIVKAITALVSLSTAIALFAKFNAIVGLPTPQQFQDKENLLVEALAEANAVNETRQRIIATVSHEYRTPLTVILSSTELIERYPNSQGRQRHIDSIKRQVALLNRLIADALLLDQSDLGLFVFKPVELDAIAMACNLISAIEWNEHALEVIAVGSGIGYFDERLLSSMLTNLVYNACKYSPADTTVFVRFFGEADKLIIEIEDQGIGIPETEVDRIFDAYYRASNVDTISGTGIGLAIVQTCVSLHDGTISVNSTFGVGTIFRIVLPLLQRQRFVI